MIDRRSEGGLYIGPGCPARPAAARLRRACGGAHSRPAADPTDTALNPLASIRQGFSQQMSIDSFMARNLTQNRRNIFHLNCVPKHLAASPAVDDTKRIGPILTHTGNQRSQGPA
jgi:hypothetical protein